MESSVLSDDLEVEGDNCGVVVVVVVDVVDVVDCMEDLR